MDHASPIHMNFELMDDTHNFSNNAKHLKELGLRHDLTKEQRQDLSAP